MSVRVRRSSEKVTGVMSTPRKLESVMSTHMSLSGGLKNHVMRTRDGDEGNRRSKFKVTLVPSNVVTSERSGKITGSSGREREREREREFKG